MHIIMRKSRSAFTRIRKYFVSAKFGASPDTVYKNSFYDDGGFARTEKTATCITSYLFERFQPASVLDLGCGMGNYLKHFADKGCKVVGVEGSSDALTRVPKSVLAVQHDLRQPLFINQKFDLVMSVEVAEHIPSRYSKNLVNSICRHAQNLVVFTAAPPGTPGEDHINCRDRNFWDILFKENGFSFDEGKSAELAQYATKEDTAEWFQKRAFVYVAATRNCVSAA